MTHKQNHIIYQGNSVISVEPHPDYSQPVVVKKPFKRLPSQRILRSLEKEFEMTRSLDAVEGVRKAIGKQSIGNQPALILEYIDGVTLRDRIKSRTLSLRAKLEIAVNLTRILGNIHQHDVIHLDLNSRNILITHDDQAIRLIDLGSATIIDLSGNQSGQPDQVVGTLAYIAPEQTGRVNRAVDERSDLYSLGVTLYELMTGQLPFDSQDPLELIHHHITRVPVAPSAMSAETPEVVSAIIMKLLKKNAEDRYQSAAGVRIDLEESLRRLGPGGAIEGFSIGGSDFSIRLTFPQKLYGREAELRELEGALETACQETSALVLVGGFSGIGKTALVEEIQRPVSDRQGRFVRGKFDQYMRAIPFSAIAEAFSEFVSLLLGESKEGFNVWRGRIQSAVGDLGRVMTEIIPALEKIIGCQPAVPQLAGREAENRFNLVFVDLLKSIAAQEHPLALFIDDLQWIDAASLRLLKEIRAEFNRPGLLIIGAYRDNEVSASHPLMDIIDAPQEEGMRLRKLKLENLQLQDLEAFVTDTLRSREGTAELVKVVHDKTQGNPFFLRRLLLSLYGEGHLRNDSESKRWLWSFEDITSEPIADNVADLLVKNIERLPDETRTILAIAACVGNRFDVSTIAMISDFGEVESVGLLSAPSVRQYILESGDTYEFVHDQVQQAAHGLIDARERMSVHLQLGRALLGKAEEPELEKRIFDIVAHFDFCAELLTDPQEKIQVVELNLRAGRKAKRSSAFAAAVAYLRRALALLGMDGWRDHYERTLDVHNELIEACSLNIEYEEVDALFGTILDHVKHDIDACLAYKAMILTRLFRNELAESISLADDFLEKLRIGFVDAPKTTLSVDEVLDLLPMRDEEKLVVLEVMLAVTSPIYLAATERLPSLAVTMVDIVNKYGHSRVSGPAYNWYSLTLCFNRQYQEANRFSRLSLELLERYPNPGMAAMIADIHYAFIRHWESPVHDLIEPLKISYRVGMREGSFEWGLWCLLNHTLLIWATGMPLDDYLAEVERSIEVSKSKSQEVNMLMFRLFAQSAANLTGRSGHTTRLEGDWFSEEAMPPGLEGNTMLMALLGLQKMTLCYLLGDPREACQYIADLLACRGSLNPHYLYTKISFFGGLSCLAGLAGTESDAERQALLRALELFEEDLELWAEVAPMNYRHEYDLLRAEKSRVANEHWQAARFYEKAIKAAQENHFVHEEALANELCARFWQERENNRIAEMYMREARALYHQWGASAKIRQLENRYPQWFQTKPISAGEPDSPVIAGKVLTTLTQPIAPIQMDLDSITSASRMLSAETDLQQLLSQMITLLMANSGAEKVVLLLRRDDNWFVQAQGDSTREEYDVFLNQLFDPNRSEGDVIPVPVFNFCLRAKEALVIGDVQKDHRFAKDKMIRTHHIKSIACIPSLHQGELKAMLYLENRQLADAFTLERMGILKHLSSQFSISVENALLYDNLKQTVRQLREDEEQLSLIYDSVASVLFYIEVEPDDCFRFSTINHAFLITTGLTEDQIVGKRIEEVIPETSHQLVLNNYKKAINEKRIVRWEETSVYPSGEKIGEVSIAPVFNDKGICTHLIGSVHDITERKQAEDSLRKSEERFELAVTGSAAGIWDWDVLSDKVYFSDRVKQFLGYAPDVIWDSPDDVWNRLHPADIESVRLALEQHLEKRVPFRIDFRLQTRSGDYRWYYSRGQALWNEAGKAIRMSGSIIDITDRKQAEKEIRNSERRFRNLLDQSPMPIEILSLDGKIIQANPAWRKLWDLDEAGAAEAMEKYNMLTDPQLKELGIDHLVENAFSGEHVILPPIIYNVNQAAEDLEIEIKEGFTSPWVQCHLYPIKDKDGQLVHVINTYMDISEQKHAEDELRTAYTEIKILKEQLEAESAYLQDEIKLEHNFKNIVGQSEALTYVLNRVEQVAPTGSPVLIMGETGTGKELMARALHEISPHGKRALVKVNCAALPRELIEAELFGREKGAYTGATSSLVGRFELAGGSTLFLDEIGELPLELQAKLLRVLESGAFERLGSTRTLRSDARIIAATNRVLDEEVRKGRFREDLWYRLKVFPITVPPLRERPEDIPLLVQWYVDQLSRKMGKQVAMPPKRTMDMLQRYPWPGNVRELKHAIESALITARGKKLSFELPQMDDFTISGFKPFEEMERDYILRVLKARNWKIGGKGSAAQTLGMHVNTLRGRMKKLGIKKPKLR